MPQASDFWAQTKLGPLTLWLADDILVALDFGNTGGGRSGNSKLSQAWFSQIDEYATGARRRFELPFAVRGTPWQQKVWQGLLEIEYGQTVSYGQLASQIGAPKAARAIGNANGRNKIPIVIPCHRVVPADGSIGGYTGGLAIKRDLLAIEGLVY